MDSCCGITLPLMVAKVLRMDVDYSLGRAWKQGLRSTELGQVSETKLGFFCKQVINSDPAIQLRYCRKLKESFWTQCVDKVQLYSQGGEDDLSATQPGDCGEMLGEGFSDGRSSRTVSRVTLDCGMLLWTTGERLLSCSTNAEPGKVMRVTMEEETVVSAVVWCEPINHFLHSVSNFVNFELESLKRTLWHGILRVFVYG